LASAAAWQIQSWRYNTTMADQSHRHALEVATLQETLNRINEEATRQLVAQQKLQQAQAAALASLEATPYQELRRAQNENARLRADVAAGHVRVPVSAVCSATDKIGAGDVPAPPSPPAWMMEPSEPNFTQRLLDTLSGLEEKLTSVPG